MMRIILVIVIILRVVLVIVIMLSIILLVVIKLCNTECRIKPSMLSVVKLNVLAPV